MTQKSPLLNTKQAAEYLGVSSSCLNKWRCQRRGPEYVRLSPTVIRYYQHALDKFAQGNLFCSTSQYPADGKAGDA